MPRSDMRRRLTGSFNPVLSTIRCSSPAPLPRTVQYDFGVNVNERTITSTDWLFTGVSLVGPKVELNGHRFLGYVARRVSWLVRPLFELTSVVVVVSFERLE